MAWLWRGCKPGAGSGVGLTGPRGRGPRAETVGRRSASRIGVPIRAEQRGTGSSRRSDSPMSAHRRRSGFRSIRAIRAIRGEGTPRNVTTDCTDHTEEGKPGGRPPWRIPWSVLDSISASAASPFVVEPFHEAHFPLARYSAEPIEFAGFVLADVGSPAHGRPPHPVKLEGSMAASRAGTRPPSGARSSHTHCSAPRRWMRQRKPPSGRRWLTP
jgi:hypothetical protein